MADEDVIEGDVNEHIARSPPIAVTVWWQPVLRRETRMVDEKAVNGATVTRQRLVPNGFVRTKEPLEVRTERLLHLSAIRATVTWNDGVGGATSSHEFLLKWGRMVGRADWLLEPDCRARLAKMAKDTFDRPMIKDAAANDSKPEEQEGPG